jgi:hypothetical protein
VKRFTLLGVIAGALLIVIGIIVMWSVNNETLRDQTRTAGMLVMSFGAMAIAIALYVDARQMQSKKKKEAAQTDARLRCFVCGSAPATMRCQKHMVRLCYDCISRHDEGEQCYYAPLNRTRKASAQS